MKADPLFDTNIIIDWLKNREEAKVELLRYKRHSISRITWMEVLAGEPPSTRDEVVSLLNRFEIIELSEDIALLAADLRFRLRLKLLDAMILATAQISGRKLVTRNTKDFPETMAGIRVPYHI